MTGPVQICWISALCMSVSCTLCVWSVWGWWPQVPDVMLLLPCSNPSLACCRCLHSSCWNPLCPHPRQQDGGKRWKKNPPCPIPCPMVPPRRLKVWFWMITSFPPTCYCPAYGYMAYLAARGTGKCSLGSHEPSYNPISMKEENWYWAQLVSDPKTKMIP